MKGEGRRVEGGSLGSEGRSGNDLGTSLGQHLHLSVPQIPKEIVDEVSKALTTGQSPPTVFDPVKEHLYRQLDDMYMNNFAKRFVCVVTSFLDSQAPV